MRWLRGVALVLCLAHLAGDGLAQDQIRTWGASTAGDTELFTGRIARLSVATNRDLTMALTIDGRLLAFGSNQGGEAIPPAAPAGLVFTDLVAGGVPFASLSDGSLVQWPGFNPPAALPVLPAGMRWVELASALQRSFALRSDGVIVSWGQTSYGLDQVPVLAAGLRYRSVVAGGFYAAALVSDGTVRTWGFPVVQSIPALPVGVQFVRVRAGHSHLIALRSDGQVVAWGDNSFGQCNVPALPAGTHYSAVVAGGFHSFALRSDGQWLAWGRNDSGQCDIPAAPNGTYVEIFGGIWHSMARRRDGALLSWGNYVTVPRLPAGRTYREFDVWAAGAVALESEGSLDNVLMGQLAAVPQLPAGVSYVSCDAGYNFVLGLGSDGQVRAWGDNLHGQWSVPPLPAGLTYTAIDAGSQTAVALRSDGSAVAWGDNGFNQTTVPVLPAGLRYVDAAAGQVTILLLRSDGVVIATGGAAGLPLPPPPPPGARYTALSCVHSIVAALCSDGNVVSASGALALAVPPLPPGLSYVEVAAGYSVAHARRSDGVVVSWAPYAPNATPVPDPGPGRSYLRIAANFEWSGGLIGSASRYVPIGTGCAGSMPAPRLVPRDTPQLGRTMPILATNLPENVALLVHGWSQVTPGLSLAPLGMPGCTAHVAMDGVTLLSGSGGDASFELEVPDAHALLGAPFFHQALVLDSGATGPGAVVSEAMQGTIGG